MHHHPGDGASPAGKAAGELTRLMEVVDRLRAAGYRADVAEATEPLGKRIRNAKVQKLPYVLVVGDDDVAHDTVGVNARGEDVERDVPLADFMARVEAGRWELYEATAGQSLELASVEVALDVDAIYRDPLADA